MFSSAPHTGIFENSFPFGELFFLWLSFAYFKRKIAEVFCLHHCRNLRLFCRIFQIARQHTSRPKFAPRAHRIPKLPPRPLFEVSEMSVTFYVAQSLFPKSRNTCRVCQSLQPQFVLLACPNFHKIHKNSHTVCRCFAQNNLRLVLKLALLGHTCV